MTRCPRCGKSFHRAPGEGAGTCDACGTELVTEGRAAVALPSYTEVVKVYAARDEAELGLVRAILAGADVPVFAYGEHLRGAAAGALPEASRTLLVPVGFARRALSVLREQGVLKPEPPAGDDALTSFWRSEVAPALAGMRAAPPAEAVALRPAPFRAALFAALSEAGPRGLSLAQDLALALALSGPSAAALEAASFLEGCPAFRDDRSSFILALGAIATRGAEADLALRAIACLERFRGAPAAERALVPLLDHASAAVRDAAIEALFSISGGETLGYEPDAPPAVRDAAVRRWRDRTGGKT